MEFNNCPRCNSANCVKSGIVNERQRFRCKSCNYFFSVNKMGKKIDNYYVTKALQLYLEGLSCREIERILGISHVSIGNWVREFKIKKPALKDYHPTYKIYSHNELVEFLKQKENLAGAGMVINELGDKFMIIKWERFKD